MTSSSGSITTRLRVSFFIPASLAGPVGQGLSVARRVAGKLSTMKALIPLLAVLLAGCVSQKPAAFIPPPSWNPEPLAPRLDPVAQAKELLRRRQASQAEAAATARQAYLASHPDLSARDRELVQQGRYAIGWPSERVVISIGEPQRISQTVSAAGQVETWSYRSGSELLQFVNGTLTTFHIQR